MLTQSPEKKSSFELTSRQMAALFGVSTQRLFQIRKAGLAVMVGRDRWSLPDTIRTLYETATEEAKDAKALRKELYQVRHGDLADLVFDIDEIKRDIDQPPPGYRSRDT